MKAGEGIAQDAHGADHPEGGRGLRELARIVTTLVLVTGATAAALRAVDALPAYLGGAGREVVPVRSVQELERRWRAPLHLPVYFPDTLRWPPAAIRLHPGPPRSVALVFVDRAGDPRVVLFQSADARAAPPPALLPAGRVLQTAPVARPGAPATLRRLVDGEGRIWHEVDWVAGGERVLLRSRGAVEELLRMSESVRARP